MVKCTYDMKQVFFLCIKLSMMKIFVEGEKAHGGGATCEFGLLWNVRSANSATTTPKKTKRIIPTGWKQANTANSAKSILCTKKQSKIRGYLWQMT